MADVTRETDSRVTTNISSLFILTLLTGLFLLTRYTGIYLGLVSFPSLTLNHPVMAAGVFKIDPKLNSKHNSPSCRVPYTAYNLQSVGVGFQ